MNKILLFLIGFFFVSIHANAADDPLIRKSERIYQFVVAGQGDSIHACLADDLKGKLSPALFNDTFRQLEKQFGKLRSAGDWKTDLAEGIKLYYRDVHFANYNLRLLLAYNADGKMNTIRFVPAPQVSDEKVVTFNKEKIEEQEIKIQSGNFTLPGTLTLPKGGKNLAVVILVHGSGPNDRDETLGPNKPFRDIAWGLAEQGIAVIRYDKRAKVYGLKSVPAGEEINLDNEVVDDALAAIRLAKALPEVNAKRVYVLGHSLGGMLAPRIAERGEQLVFSPDSKADLAGIIILAGNARPFEDLLPEQVAYIASLQDSSEATKAQIEELKRQVANVKKLGTDAFDSAIPLPLGMPESYWKSILAYKQVGVAAKLKLPILILQGERDYQVTMEDFGLWRFGLFRNANVQYKSYPKLNHLLQEGSGKSTPFEYNHASPVPAYIIGDIADFVNEKEVK